MNLPISILGNLERHMTDMPVMQLCYFFLFSATQSAFLYQAKIPENGIPRRIFFRLRSRRVTQISDYLYHRGVSRPCKPSDRRPRQLATSS